MKFTLYIFFIFFLTTTFSQTWTTQRETVATIKSYYLNNLWISPDGKTLAYEQSKDGKSSVVVNGKEGKGYDWVGYFTFSPNSSKFAYQAQIKGQAFIVVGDKEGKRYTWIGPHDFVNDKIAYVAEIKGKNLIVVGNKEGLHYDGIETFFPISSDHKKMGYVGIRNKKKKRFLVLEGKEQKEYDSVYGIEFTADGVIYVAQEGNKHFIVRNDKEDKSQLNVQDFTLNSAGKIAYVLKKGKKVFVVEGNRKSALYDEVRRLQYSPDGKTLAYIAQKGNKKFVVVGKKEGKGYPIIVEKMVMSGFDGEGEEPPTTKTFTRSPIDYFRFSANSKTIAYVVKKKKENEKEFLVVETKEGKEYMGIYGYSLSPNGKTVAYKALNSYGGKIIVVGDQEGTDYNKTTMPVFVNSNTICYFAHDKDTIYRITLRKK